MPFWLACAYLLARPALAHDFWIQASDFRPPPGARVALSLHVGQDFGGEVLPRIDEWIVRFDYHDAGGCSRCRVSWATIRPVTSRRCEPAPWWPIRASVTA